MKGIIFSKIKKGVIVFMGFVVAFLLITYIGYFVEVKCLDDSMYSYLEYLLYLLGYGELDNVNIWFRLFFSIGSLLILTLFSSACTVTWLESRRILKLDDCIVISKNEDNNFIASVRLSSKKRAVYSAKVSIIINTDQESFSEETEIAYIPKKEFVDAVFDVKLNSVVYKYFKEFYKGNPKQSEVVVTVTYSDIHSGEEYTVCEKFSYKNATDFIFCDTLDYYIPKKNVNNKVVLNEFESFIKRTKFEIDLTTGEIVNSKKNDRLTPAKAEVLDVRFDSDINYENWDFQMLCISVPVDEDWGVYHDIGCDLNIELDILNDIDVCVEIKKDDGRIVPLHPSPKMSKGASVLNVKLSKYRRHTWENIKEVCFTVFYENVRTKNKAARFTIKKCAFELPLHDLKKKYGE